MCLRMNEHAASIETDDQASPETKKSFSSEGWVDSTLPAHSETPLIVAMLSEAPWRL